jgi:hypothetical protein
MRINNHGFCRKFQVGGQNPENLASEIQCLTDAQTLEKANL